MTQEEAKRRAELYSALAEGKTIQVKNPNGTWEDVNIEGLNKIYDYNNYRIKPESKYRPFKTQEECWNEMLKHQPFGWIICKTIGNYYNIEFLYSHKDNEHGVGLNSYAVFIDFETMFKGYNFADGEPFGISEE